MPRMAIYNYPNGTSVKLDYDKFDPDSDESKMILNEQAKKRGGPPTIIEDPEYIGGNKLFSIPTMFGMRDVNTPKVKPETARGLLDTLLPGMGGEIGALGGMALGARRGPVGAAAGSTAGASALGGLGQVASNKAQESLGLIPSDVSPVQTGLLSGIGQGLGMGIPALGKGMLGRLIRGGPADEVAERAVQARAAGRNPSVPQVMDEGHWTAGAMDWLHRNPVTSKIIAKWAKSSNDSLRKDMLRRTEISPINRMLRANESGMRPSMSLGGTRINRAIKTFDDIFHTKAGIKYDDFFSDLPAGFARPIKNFGDALSDMIKRDPLNDIFNKPRIKKLMMAYQDNYYDDVNKVHLPKPYDEVKQLRTSIGEEIGRARETMSPPEDLQNLKKLYAALTKDMREAIANEPRLGAASLKKFDDASNYWKNNVTLMEDYLDKYYKISSPDKTLKTFESAVRGGDIRELASIKRAFKADKENGMKMWDDTVRTLTDRMMLSKDDSTPMLGNFVYSYRNMEPNLKTLLFGNTNLDLRKSLDNLAKVASEYDLPIDRANPLFLRQELKQAASPVTAPLMAGLGGSGAAGLAGATGGMSIGVGVLSAAVLGYMGPRKAAKMLTNPKTVDWLSSSFQINPKGMPAHIGRLVAIAKGLPDEEYDAVLSFLQGYEQVTEQQQQQQ